MRYRFKYQLCWYRDEKSGETMKWDHVELVKHLNEWKQNHKDERFDFKVKPNEHSEIFGDLIVRTNKTKMDTVIMLDSFLGEYLNLTWL